MNRVQIRAVSMEIIKNKIFRNVKISKGTTSVGGQYTCKVSGRYVDRFFSSAPETKPFMNRVHIRAVSMETIKNKIFRNVKISKGTT